MNIFNLLFLLITTKYLGNLELLMLKMS